LRERRGGEWNAAERSESASQNSFSIPTSQKVAALRVSSAAEIKIYAVRPEGADYQWRKVPPGELSIVPVADEQLGRVTGRVEAS
jgi:hypothetical protein